MNVNLDIAASGDSTTVSSFDQHAPSEGGRDGGSFEHEKLPTVNLEEIVVLQFEPKVDITAYELAILLPLVLRGYGTLEEVKSLGTSRKHIKEESLQQLSK